MAQQFITGIDVGTHQVKAVIAENSRERSTKGLPRVVGSGLSESKGLRHGYIINGDDVTRAVRAAIAQAERTAGSRVRSAFISAGGAGLDELRAKGMSIISRADSEVTDLDIEKATEAAQTSVAKELLNRRVLHTIPLSYKIDGKDVMGRPHGMKGAKLEVDVLFVTYLEQHLSELVAAVEEADIEVKDIMAAPLAGSFVTLTKAQKMAGCVYADIGAETVSIVVFEHGLPISLKTFPIGASAITNDIALGLKIPIEEAEQLKMGAVLGGTYPKKKLDDIISARLADIFELIEGHLKTLGKNELLPAGIIIAGGGAGIGNISDIARSSLKLPSRAALLTLPEHSKIKDSTWAVAYGLTIWGSSEGGDGTFGSNAARVRKTGASIISFFKQFLP